MFRQSFATEANGTRRSAQKKAKARRCLRSPAGCRTQGSSKFRWGLRFEKWCTKLVGEFLTARSLKQFRPEDPPVDVSQVKPSICRLSTNHSQRRVRSWDLEA